MRYFSDVEPNYLKEDFLNAFMTLPSSFHAPKSPEKFMNFIQQYGTHYVKAAKFGGQLKVIKSRAITSTSSITDFRKEKQTQVNEITRTKKIKQREESTSKIGQGSKLDLLVPDIHLYQKLKVLRSRKNCHSVIKEVS